MGNAGIEYAPFKNFLDTKNLDMYNLIKLNVAKQLLWQIY